MLIGAVVKYIRNFFNIIAAIFIAGSSFTMNSAKVKKMHILHKYLLIVHIDFVSNKEDD